LIIVVTLQVCAQYQSGHYRDDGLGIRYRFGEPNIIEREDRGEIKTGTYSVDDSSGISFLIMQWENNASERYLMLEGDILCLYKDDGEPVYFGYHYSSDDWHEEDDHNWDASHVSVTENITASSSLRDGNAAYTPDNLDLRLNSVWAEGKEGQGIHEKLFIPFPAQFYYEIYISGGYVSYSKSYLYKENSRPKKIRIYFGDEESLQENYMDVELKDTPRFQYIPLYRIVNWEDYNQDNIIEIEILEVYPGTKYEDTCINSILHKWGM
jgi:hypothetical protein